MYEAKQKGRNNYKFFTKAIDEAVTKRLETEALLCNSIENNELFLLFQPKVNIQTGEVVGVEALIRWQHPNLGIMLPAQFMSVAEDSGLSLDIGKLVINNVCKQLQQWASEGIEGIKVSINLSALQLLHNGIVNDFKKALILYKINPALIEIELNESALLADEKSCIDLLNQFKLLGVESALDNFGTGCLSLEYISRLPFTVIKFDRVYLQSVEDSLKGSRVLNAEVTLAKALSFDVVLTGVETEEQLNIIQAMPVEYAQGYYFSRPVAVNDLSFRFATSPQR
jgi:EAL domain-containing protein (putative c-di-GMP-specific phosphodiesterase class I)